MCAPNSDEDDGEILTPDKPPSSPRDSILDDGDSLADQARLALRNGTYLTAASLSLLLAANSLTLPYRQSRRDALGCDSLCVGSLTSARSAATLVGATVLGKWADVSPKKRLASLFMGVAAAGIALGMEYRATAVTELWWAVLPNTLQQNVSLSKAALGDYQKAVGNITPSERAGSAGILGMAVGLAFMIGPLLGALLQTYEQSMLVAGLMLLIATIMLSLLPKIVHAKPERRTLSFRKESSSFLSFLDVPSARTPAALFLIAYRITSALSFHIYQTIWAVHMKEELMFGPQEYGRFFSVIGFVFAVAQGFLAKKCIDYCSSPKERGILLAFCSLIMAVARYAAFQTTDMFAVYSLFSIMVTAFGITSTIISADTTHVASPQELGSFFGLLTAAESGAGMTGPLLGGALGYYVHTAAPLAAVICLNIALFCMVMLGYDRHVLQQLKHRDAQELLEKKYA